MIDHARGGRQRVLILDDDREFCDGLKTRLGRLGFQVLLAHDGDLAVRQARKRQPDAILADPSMAEGEGRHVLRRIARDPATRHIPVLLVRVGSVPYSAEQLREVGAAVCLAKPIVMPTLLLALARLTGGSRHAFKKALAGTGIDIVGR